MKEENQAIIKALNMYGRVPEMWKLLEEIERLGNELQVQIEDNTRLNEYIEEKNKEVERLNKQIEEYQKALDETTSEKVDLHSIINKIRNYVYKPIDKEWDDILCIIEDGLKESEKV